MRAVILAGGKGARLAGLRDDIPKPLFPVAGVPVLTRQLTALKNEGITQITVVTCHMSALLEARYGDGRDLGVSLRYYKEPAPLGTAGALPLLDLKEDFLLLNGDLVFDFDLASMLEFHKKHNALATLFAHPNAHPFDSALLQTEENGRVTGFLPKEGKPAVYENLCNAGIGILSPALLKDFSPDGPADLDRDLLLLAVSTGRIYAYKSYEYVKDMGTPERLAAVERDVAAGLPRLRRRDRPQRAVFLDRDGTVNVYRGFISDPACLELAPGAAAAVRKLNELGYLAVLATNQPVVARGLCDERTLCDIHRRLQTLLGAEGAFLDGIYVCPHHPDKGFPGEAPELKIDCDCRKPKPGLLLRAAAEMHIDLSASYMVGDTARDVGTGKNAGCTPVFLRCGKPEPEPADVAVFDDLAAFVRTLE